MSKIKMVKIWILLILLGGAGILSVTSCGPSPTTPAAPTPTPTFNYGALSASATIGSSAEFSNPSGLANSNGTLWVLDQGNNTLQQWTTLGVQSKAISVFNTSDSFSGPWGIAVDPLHGNIWVTDENQRVIIFDSTGAYLTQITVGSGDVRGIAFNGAGTTAYVTDFNSGGYIYTVGGTASVPTLTANGTFGTSGSGTLTNAYQDTVDPSGNVWVADYFGAKVEEYGSTGTDIKTLTSADFVHPTYVKVMADGKILVTDEGPHEVLVFNSAGTKITTFGSSALAYPEDFVVIGGKYYITDWNSSHIVVLQ